MDRTIHPNSVLTRRSPFAALAGTIVLILALFTIPVLTTACSSDVPGVPDWGRETLVRVSFASPVSISRYGTPSSPLRVTPRLPVTRSAPTAGVRAVDVFIFRDEAPYRLECYSHGDGPLKESFPVSSTGGDKRLVVVANLPEETVSLMDVSQIDTYDALCSFRTSLRDEDPEYPVMSGETVFCPGERCEVVLQPCMSVVELNTVSCDFSGRPYADALLEDASAYLTNVNASVQVLRHDGFRPVEHLNRGRLSAEDMDSMSYPGMLWEGLETGLGRSGHAVGKTPFLLGKKFFAYPNDVPEESPGSPFTRLVLEGELEGRRYYYPININRGVYGRSGGPEGLARNVRYVLDLTVTRTGSSDPDDPIFPEEVVEKGWIELHPGNLLWGRTGERIHVWCDMYPENAELDICREDLDYDVERGVYEYEMDPDGHGVVLTLKGDGTGMFTIDAGPPIDAGFLVIIVVNPYRE